MYAYVVIGRKTGAMRQLFTLFSMTVAQHVWAERLINSLVRCHVDWIGALEKHGLEFGDTEQLLAKLDELIEAAPEADESDEDSD